ncbi:flagellar hook-length control protein FliK [Roseovarius spongiae]|nr:flagellar hook-length control protein FliK [Roseovarius spongiae]
MAERDNTTGRAARSGDTGLTGARNHEENAQRSDDHDSGTPTSDQAGFQARPDQLRPEAEAEGSPLADTAGQGLAASSVTPGESGAGHPALPVSQRAANPPQESAVFNLQGLGQDRFAGPPPDRARPAVVRMEMPETPVDAGKASGPGAKAQMAARPDGGPLKEAAPRSAPLPSSASTNLSDGIGAKVGDMAGPLRPVGSGRADLGQVGEGTAQMRSDATGAARGQGIGSPNGTAALTLANARSDSLQAATTTTGGSIGRSVPEATDPPLTDQPGPRHDAAARGVASGASDPREPGARNAQPLRLVQGENIRAGGAQSPASSATGPFGIAERPLSGPLADHASDTAELGAQDWRGGRIGPSDVQPASPHRPDDARRVAVQIAEAARGGGERPIDLNLNPAELGRVRITLSGADGMMHVTVSAERGETLDLIRRHIELLSEAFRDIGYGGSSFAFSHERDAQDRSGSGRSPSATQDEPSVPPAMTDVAPSQRATRADRLDIRL